jgi:hypothetical protein
VMNMDMVKPMPPSMPAPIICRQLSESGLRTQPKRLAR